MYNVDDRWNNRNKTKGNLMNPNPPQITSPGSIASKISQEEQKKLAPTTTIPNEVQPVIPDMDTKMPDPSEYHQFQDLYTELYENPITPEEEEKRKRAATAVEGIGHLGNVMNAFSNLIFTGKGAPSQELPKVPDEIQAFEDRMAEKRRMYANGMMGAKARDLQDWKDAYAMKRQEAIDKSNEALDKQKSQINEYNIKYQELRNAGYPAKLAADLALKQSQIEENKAGAYRNRKQGEAAVIRANKSSSSGSSSSGKGKKDYGFKRLEGPNGATMSYNMNDDRDVVNLYREAKKWRLVDGDAKSVNQMREELFIKTGEWKVDKTGKFIDSSKLGRKDSGDSEDFSEYAEHNFEQYKVK